MAFGITDTGFVRKRLPDIKAELETELRSRLGDINTGPDSVIGQIIGVLSKASADTWDALEATYNAMYPSTATGVPLDNAVELVGIRRIAATASRAALHFLGVNGTVIPVGMQVQIPETEDVFATVTEVAISKSTAVRAELSFVVTSAGT